VLYCNPGFAVRINESPERESDEMLEYLFVHQLQPQFRYTNVWTENDLLLWDHLSTLHRAIADYGPDETSAAHVGVTAPPRSPRARVPA
jgi:taurine dioxygenase